MSNSRFEDSTFTVKSPSEVPLDNFRDAMERNCFACIRGVISPEESDAALERLTASFSRSNDHPATGEKSDSVRRNFQKLIVGGESRARANNDDARLFRVFYNPLWAEDIYGMRDIFVRLAQVRNVIAELPIEFATAEIEPNGLWTASRVHQYPIGGGFFQGHTDYVVSDVADQASTKFYQLLLLMTEKGKHFEQGGGFVDKGEERIFLEDYFGPGDILVYDGRTRHGVEDIDAHRPLDLETFNGRVAAFVTLFKALS